MRNTQYNIHDTMLCELPNSVQEKPRQLISCGSQELGDYNLTNFAMGFRAVGKIICNDVNE